MKKYSGLEFAAQLKEDTLPRTTSIIGMVELDGQDPSTLLFTPHTTCDGWTPIPVEAVESVDHLGQNTCGDHTHPLVRLHLSWRPGDRTTLERLEGSTALVTGTDSLEVRMTTRKGRGVFARWPFKADEEIERAPILFIDEGQIRGAGGYNDLAVHCFGWQDRFVALALGYGSLYNHSTSPSARHSALGPNVLSFRAVRDIPAGEEITIDYGGATPSYSQGPGHDSASENIPHLAMKQIMKPPPILIPMPSGPMQEPTPPPTPMHAHNPPFPLVAGEGTKGVPQVARTHMISLGEDLPRLSRLYLGSSARWQEIQRVDGSDFSDPDDPLLVGQVVLLPGS